MHFNANHVKIQEMKWKRKREPATITDKREVLSPAICMPLKLFPTSFTRKTFGKKKNP